jgi:8-oxo-dGTP pyrophosphatase MutT (NUDIX family)
MLPAAYWAAAGTAGLTHVNTTQPLRRCASRLILLDPEGRILLFQYEDSRGTWWATPGGGLQEGETFGDAAAREAEEELGLTDLDLEPLWERTTEFETRGARIRQQERYFLVRSHGAEVTFDGSVRQAHVIEGIMAPRWWRPDEIATTAERVFPEDLVHRLRCVSRRT